MLRKHCITAAAAAAAIVSKGGIKKNVGFGSIANCVRAYDLDTGLVAIFRQTTGLLEVIRIQYFAFFFLKY